MKRALLAVIMALSFVSNASAYTGAGSISYLAKGRFIPGNTNGDSTGFGRARDICIAAGGGVIQLGPGCENVITTYPANAGLTVIKAFTTGWAIDPFAVGGSATGYGLVTGTKKGSFNTKGFDGTDTGLQQAYNYADSGGVVNIYSGYYPITIPLTISKPGIRVIAQGDSVILANYLSTDVPLLTVTGPGTSLEGIYFDGRKSLNANGRMVSVKTNNITISKCKFYQTPNEAVYFDTLNTGQGMDGARISECRFTDIGTTTSGRGYGILGSRVAKSQISGNKFFNIANQATRLNLDSHDIIIGGNQVDSTGFGTEIDTYSKGGFFADTLGYRFQVNNNTLRRATTFAIDVWADSSQIVDNAIYSGSAGIHLHGGCTSSKVLGNLVISPQLYGLYLELYKPMYQTDITGNTITGAGARGIHIEFNSTTSSDINVSDNTILYSGRTANISAIGCLSVNLGKVDRLNISGNKIIGSRKAGIEFSQSSGTGGYFRSTRVIGNQITYSGNAPIITNAMNGGVACSLYIANNYYYQNTPDTPTLSATGWTYNANGIINGQFASLTATDSLRVNKVANFDQGIQATGNSWIAGRLTVGDSLRVNKVANFDAGTQVTGNSWVAGKYTVRDSLRVNKVANFDQGIQTTGNSWVAGRLTVGDSLRVNKVANFDAGTQTTGNSWVSGKFTVADTLNVVGTSGVVDVALNVGKGNISVASNNGYKIRGAADVPKMVMYSDGTDLILQPVGGTGGVNLKSVAGPTMLATDNLGNTYIALKLRVTDSLRVGGTAQFFKNTRMQDSLNLSGVLKVGRLFGTPQYHEFGNGGTGLGDTLTLALNATNDGSGLSTRSPKILMFRNSTPAASMEAYAGGLEIKVPTGNRVGIGALGTATNNLSLFADGAVTGTTITGDSLISNNNVYITGYLELPALSQILFKDGGGTLERRIYTGGGDDLHLSTGSATGNIFLENSSLGLGLAVRGTGQIRLGIVTFANLPTQENGALIYCSDCTKANPCASGGTGSMAFGVNGAWECNH